MVKYLIKCLINILRVSYRISLVNGSADGVLNLPVEEFIHSCEKEALKHEDTEEGPIPVETNGTHSVCIAAEATEEAVQAIVTILEATERCSPEIIHLRSSRPFAILPCWSALGDPLLVDEGEEKEASVVQKPPKYVTSIGDLHFSRRTLRGRLGPGRIDCPHWLHIFLQISKFKTVGVPCRSAGRHASLQLTSKDRLHDALRHGHLSAHVMFHETMKFMRSVVPEHHANGAPEQRCHHPQHGAASPNF
mmetsp:Transcript_32878/g.60169  ORF Transcript_32878/g.60169 Transcript_32878/m.60169 type:complete len:249 (-) Transcript_32878:67-813(-)